MKKKVKVNIGEHGTEKHNANTAQEIKNTWKRICSNEARKAGRRPTFSAGMTANLKKRRQWIVVMVRIGELSEELRILRQTEGVSAGEKKAISAMLDKIGKFNDYVANCLIMEGGAK